MITSVAPPSNDMLTITLWETSGDGVIVRSVDVLNRTVSHRMSFVKSNGLRQTMAPAMAERIEQVIASLPRDAGVFTEPDFVLEMKSLMLARLRVLVSTTKTGVRQVILRFKYFLGSLQDAFLLGTHFAPASLEHRERIAVETLVDIAAPIYDMAHIDSSSPVIAQNNGAVERRLDELARNAEELKFYMALLSRYVAQAAEDRAARAHNVIELDDRRQLMQGH